jgi:hypothetical protein
LKGNEILLLSGFVAHFRKLAAFIEGLLKTGMKMASDFTLALWRHGILAGTIYPVVGEGLYTRFSMRCHE